MTLLIVDGVELKSPTKFDTKLADIDSANSGRSESGIMTREVIRRKVATINAEFANISTAEYKKIVGAINKDFVTVDFFSGESTLQRATMYCSEVDSTLISAESDLWTVSFQLTEQ